LKSESRKSRFSKIIVSLTFALCVGSLSQNTSAADASVAKPETQTETSVKHSSYLGVVEACSQGKPNAVIVAMLEDLAKKDENESARAAKVCSQFKLGVVNPDSDDVVPRAEGN
jgi:hypothetical protein